jgi:hypothetical protein
MPNWYAEDDDGHVRCYFGDKNGHELDECDVVHKRLHEKWERQRNMKPLPTWLQKVADAQTWTLNAQQAYYDRDEDVPDDDPWNDSRDWFLDRWP